MTRRAFAGLVGTVLVSGCVDLGAERELDSERSSQRIIRSELLGRGHGWGGQATGGAAGVRYVVTSTADDGSCGTLRYGIELPGAKWITFDPQVFPPNVKKAINLSRALDVPSNTTIDGRGSWVSLRRAYDTTDVYWKRYGDAASGTYECSTPSNRGKGPIVSLDGVSNVILTNLDFYKTYPLGTVAYDDDDADELPESTQVNLDNVDLERIDAQCFDDEVKIQGGSTEIWVDHSDFAHCGDECVSVRDPAPDRRTEVTISNNLFTNAWKAILVGASADMTPTNSIGIVVSVYQNRFVGVRYRQPRIEATVAHVYNNLYEDWHGNAVEAHAHTSNTLVNERPDIVVRTRALVEHNAFRAVSRTTGAWIVREQAENENTSKLDAVLWAKTNRCTRNTACADTTNFPRCNSAWYFPCDSEHRANLISLSSMDYTAARDRLRPLAGSSRTIPNDTYGYAALSCTAVFVR